MVNLILFILSSIGLCHILVDSALFAPVRDWIKDKNIKQPWCFIDKIFSCYQCMGCWGGWFCGFFLLTYWPLNIIDYFTNFAVVFMAGFAGSFLSSFAANYLVYLSARSVVELPTENQ
jgi:hypothetical protein